MSGQIENVEDVSEVLVGRTYLVNTIRTLTRSVWQGERAPLLGTMHEDRQLIGFIHDHIHVDWRFVSHAQIEFITGQVRYENPDRTMFSLLGFPLSVGYAISIGANQKRIPLECKRTFAVFPDDSKWMADLERAYIGKRACKDICPHRGISLVDAPEDPNIPGSRVCPGHGLCFDRETGVLRPRAMLNESLQRRFNA